MKALLLATALAAQMPDLERDYLATIDGSASALVAIIARHEDGSPLRGTIQCSGYWFKYADEDEKWSGWDLPFVTDSRGAIVMNPHKDDHWFVCWASGYQGRVLVDLTSGQSVFEMVVRRSDER